MASYESVLFQGLLQSLHLRPEDELLQPALVQIMYLGIIVFRLDVQYSLRSYYETKFHVSIIEPYQRTVVASSEGEVNVCYRIWTYGNFSADRLRDARMENILRFRYKDSAPTIEEEKNSGR